jgi:hypothetical protein
MHSYFIFSKFQIDQQLGIFELNITAILSIFKRKHDCAVNLILRTFRTVGNVKHESFRQLTDPYRLLFCESF